MRKCATILFLSTLAMLSIYCSRDKSNSVVTNLEYDQPSNSLKVDFLNDPEKSLRDIIHLSEIQKSGYGLLLNLDNSYSKSELDTLKRQFQKLDINAVHSFNIVSKDSLQNKIKVAMEGAQFIWILENKQDWENQYLGFMIRKIQSSNENPPLVVR